MPRSPLDALRTPRRAFGVSAGCALLAAALAAPTAGLAVPTVVPFVADLATQTGPLPDLIEVDAVLLDVQGDPVWGHTYPAIPVQGGVFVLALGGDGSPALDGSLLPEDGAQLELTIDGQTLSPPFALGSAPYALRSGDASTLGGQPPSAYVTGAQLTADLHPVALSGDYNDLANLPAGGNAQASGTSGRLARFTGATSLGDSALFEDAQGRVGLGTTSPQGALEIRGGGAGALLTTTAAGALTAAVGSSLNAAGLVQTFGPNGSGNTASGPSSGDPSWGSMSVGDPSGNIRARMSGGLTGGIIEVFSAIGQRFARITEAPGAVGGLLSLSNAQGEDRVALAVGPAGFGFGFTAAPGGGSLVQLSTLSTNNSRGYLSVDQGLSTSNTRVALYADGLGSGFSNTLGPNNQLNTASGPTPSNPNHGSVGVYNSAGQVRAGLFVNDLGQGVVFGDVKNFRTTHPEQPGQEIWYASLEGPEAAAYARGTAELREGRARIALPDHFRALAAPEGITVQLTPLSADSEGLAVVSKAPDHIEVVELRRGRGSYAFDYTVTAVRRGYEGYQVVRPALAEPMDLRALPARAATAP